MDPWLAAELHLADGRVPRFGPDERDEGDIPYAIQYDTQIPGGYGDGSLVLPRPPNLQADDAALFSHAVIYGPGAECFYGGRVTGVPQVEDNAIRLELEGWSAHLEDKETLQAIIVDQDLSRFGPSSAQRRANLLASSYSPGDPTTLPLGGGVETALEGAWTAASRARTEAWYGVGLPIGAAFFTWAKSASIDPGLSGWEWEARLSSDDVLTVTDSTGNLKAAGPGSGTLAKGASDSNPTARKYVSFMLQYTDAGGGDGAFYSIWWDGAVYGEHTIPLRGDAPQGVYGSDVIAYALDHGAPMLTYTLGASIETATYIIRHLVFLEPTHARNVVEQVTALGGAQLVPNDWGCYGPDGREFFHKTPGTYGRTWHVRKDQVAIPTGSGPESKERISGLMLSWRDGSGTSHSIGPPGEGAEYESSELLDTDPQNPASRLQGSKIKHREVGILGGNIDQQKEGALNIGRMLLAEANRIDWRGEVEIADFARDETGNKHPVARMKSGDQVVVEDEEGLWLPRPIVTTGYSHDPNQVRASIGATPHRSDVMLAQLAAATELVAA